VELQNTQTEWTASGGVEWSGCFGSGMLPNRPMKYYPHMKARCQQKKERNASKKAFTSIAKGGFDMTSSSDEEVHHKQHTFLPSSKSSNICLMSKGMNDSNVSDDDSCPSLHELVGLGRT